MPANTGPKDLKRMQRNSTVSSVRDLRDDELSCVDGGISLKAGALEANLFGSTVCVQVRNSA